MSTRKIRTNSDLPPLELPSAALSRRDQQYNYNPEIHPPAIEPIEHKLRVDLMVAGIPDSREQLLSEYNSYQNGPESSDPWADRSRSSLGKPSALQYAERTIGRQWESEQKYFEGCQNDTVLSQAPPYLQHQLRSCLTADGPSAAVDEEWENRKQWYDMMPWGSLYPVFKRNSLGKLVDLNGLWPSGDRTLHGNRPEKTSYIGIIVVPNDAETEAAAGEYGVEEEYVYREEEFRYRHDTELPTPSDYGINLPAPLLMGRYSNGSEYLLIPWSSGLVCQGPFKTDKPYRVCCKHEALATLVLSHSDHNGIFLPVDDGIDVPARARRFIDPHIATTHTPE